MTVRGTLQSVVDQLQATLVDAEKVDSGNKAAGTRVRKAAQEATVLLKDLRKQVLEVRNTEA